MRYQVVIRAVEKVKNVFFESNRLSDAVRGAQLYFENFGCQMDIWDKKTKQLVFRLKKNRWLGQSHLND